jgi:hypothetical protein
MLEKTFRKNLIAAMKQEGMEAVPIESSVTPGFPDMVVSNNTTALIELKVVPTFESKRLIESYFEKNQIAFYHRWWKTKSDNIWFIIYSEKEKSIICHKIHPLILKLKIGDFYRALDFFGVHNMASLIQYLQRQI